MLCFCVRIKKWVPSSLVQLELLRWDGRCSPRAGKVNVGLCTTGRDQDLQLEGRSPAMLVPGSLSSCPPAGVQVPFRTF